MNKLNKAFQKEILLLGNSLVGAGCELAMNDEGIIAQALHTMLGNRVRFENFISYSQVSKISLSTAFSLTGGYPN